MGEVVESGAVLQRGKRMGNVPRGCVGGSAQRKGNAAGSSKRGMGQVCTISDIKIY